MSVAHLKAALHDRGMPFVVMISTESIFQSLSKEMTRKKTSGTATRALLEKVEKLLSSRAGISLDAVISQPEHAGRVLAEHFRSPLACHQHIRAVISAVKSLGKLAPRETKDHWSEILKSANDKCVELKGEVMTLFSGCEGASNKTIQGYVNEVMHLMAKLNVANINEVLTKPEIYKTELRLQCETPGTERDHISKIMCIFKCNPIMKQQHPTAFRAWQCASSEHRAREMQEARLNAPINARQAENYVPMGAWKQKLEELRSQPEPSDPRKQKHGHHAPCICLCHAPKAS